MRERIELIYQQKWSMEINKKLSQANQRQRESIETKIEPKEQLDKTKNKVKMECHDRQRKTSTNTRIISKKQEK